MNGGAKDALLKVVCSEFSEQINAISGIDDQN
jgi:hypothetical protein